mgnify:FL=1
MSNSMPWDSLVYGNVDDPLHIKKFQERDESRELAWDLKPLAEEEKDSLLEAWEKMHPPGWPRNYSKSMTEDDL